MAGPVTVVGNRGGDFEIESRRPGRRQSPPRPIQLARNAAVTCRMLESIMHVKPTLDGTR